MIEIDQEPHYVVTFRQRLFVRYLLAILIDLMVLNLFVEYWSAIVIDSFTISILAAIMLQVLLRALLIADDRVAHYLNKKGRKGAKVKRFFSAWALSFGSKFIILFLIDLVFGVHVEFSGVIPFFVVVFTILGAEFAFTRIIYAGWMRSQLKADEPPSE